VAKQFTNFFDVISDDLCLDLESGDLLNTRKHKTELLLSAPPEGALGSSWLKHALKQRPPTTLIGVVRVVVVLVLFFVFLGLSDTQNKIQKGS
jgi:hypothetical protein